MSIDLATPEAEAAVVDQLRAARARIDEQLSRRITGQKEVVEQLLLCLLAGGHCLITGAPGLAKTLLVRSVSELFDLKFSPVPPGIQFTPDLMPSDVTGAEILQETPEGGRHLTFRAGPIFANVVLADEINRTPPKTQAALLEAMQEHQVTAAGRRRPLPEPFFVLATQNPIEMEGTYPLPEAQLDRFMFNVVVGYLPENEEVDVVLRTTSQKSATLDHLYSGDDVLRFQEMVRRTPIAEETARYAVRLAAASRPGHDGAIDTVKKFVAWGAGIRAGQYLVFGAKSRALLQGRTHATDDDVRAVALPVLRHRILVNYRAEAEGVTPDQVIAELLSSVRGPLA